MSKDFNYKVARTLGVPLFKGLLHPTIINKEYIPERGPILLCGNHLHVWDQFPVICATKRVTHWMAKKEYFDSKMGPLFKATGSICVDRDGDASKSTEEALEYLHNGSAVGIFPEGTRNKYQVLKNRYLYVQQKIDEHYDNGNVNANERYYELLKKAEVIQKEMDEYEETLKSKGIILDKEDLLLPFHFGAVSMAKKSGALIVPFGVTGDYTKDNDNLVVRFSEPMAVSDDLENANNKLKENIKSLVLQNYNEFGRSKK